jgi:predicted acetyltransferase
MKLEYPSIQYKESYIEAVKEFQKEGRNPDVIIDDIENDFQKFVDKFQNEASGVNLKDGFVPQTTFWGIDEDEFIGTVSVRHFLNDHLQTYGGNIGYDVRPSKRKLGYGTQMLKLVLPKAKELGITKALLTCDSTNVASRKIIESCGGIFENEVPTEKGKPTKLRFWIDLEKI